MALTYGSKRPISTHFIFVLVLACQVEVTLSRDED